MVGIHNKMCGWYFKILRPSIGSVYEGELVIERQVSRLGIRRPLYNINGVFNMLIVWETEDNIQRVPRPVLRQPPDEVTDVDTEENEADAG